MATQWNDDFAVFILTHNRPHQVFTYKTLRKQGYTGKIYLIIDNEDASASEYRKLYGDEIIEFDKAAVAQWSDTGDNNPERLSVLFARNVCFDIAEELGITYFLQLDDDYKGFYYRFSPKGYFAFLAVNRLDDIFAAMLEYYKSIPAITIAFAQGGDYVGGGGNMLGKAMTTKRKAMNSFFCSTERRFKFFARGNEDVCTYVTLGNRGMILLTVSIVLVKQFDTQTNAGGLTDIHLRDGTYAKSFYSVMYAPSCVKVSSMSGAQGKEGRIHHFVTWKNAVPCILDEHYRKRSTADGNQ